MTGQIQLEELFPAKFESFHEHRDRCVDMQEIVQPGNVMCVGLEVHFWKCILSLKDPGDYSTVRGSSCSWDFHELSCLTFTPTWMESPMSAVDTNCDWMYL